MREQLGRYNVMNDLPNHTLIHTKRLHVISYTSKGQTDIDTYDQKSVGNIKSNTGKEVRDSEEYEDRILEEGDVQHLVKSISSLRVARETTADCDFVVRSLSGGGTLHKSLLLRHARFSKKQTTPVGFAILEVNFLNRHGSLSHANLRA